MSVLVTGSGFAADDFEAARIVPLDVLLTGGDLPEGTIGVDLPNDCDPAALAPWFERLALIRVAFPAMGDGRGFSLGRRLRAMGYGGRLRAAGPLVADQAAAARSVGFDEIEIPDALAQRQPEAQWRGEPRGSYQDRLKA